MANHVLRKSVFAKARKSLRTSAVELRNTSELHDKKESYKTSNLGKYTLIINI